MNCISHRAVAKTNNLHNSITLIKIYSAMSDIIHYSHVVCRVLRGKMPRVLLRGRIIGMNLQRRLVDPRVNHNEPVNAEHAALRSYDAHTRRVRF